MRRRSIYGAIAGALLAALVFVIGTAAYGGPAAAVNCAVTKGAGCVGSSASPAPPAARPPRRPNITPPTPPTPPTPLTPPKPGDRPGDRPGGKPGGKPGGRPGGRPRPPRKPRSSGQGRRIRRAPARQRAPRTRTPGGSPTPSAPGFFDGGAPGAGDDPLTGVPNFTIRQFKIPLFLLPIYQAAGTEYGVRWEYLAAINEIETNYGRNLNVSTAGAQGWMQFMPATWKQYGVDANKDGRKDPYNPVDAIFAAARYLKAAGAPKNMRKAIFAYNHAGWYVDSVVLRTRLIAGMSPDLTGSLTGLAEARFPVRGRVKYADDVSESQARKRVKPGQNAANMVSDDPNRKKIDLFAKKGSAVIAVNDGVVKKIGRSKRLGRYVVIQDDFGNRFTYGNLGSLSAQYPVPKEDVRKQAEREASRSVAALTVDDPRPDRAASAGRQGDGAGGGSAGGGGPASASGGAQPSPAEQPSGGSRFQDPVVKERLFAHPNRPQALAAGGSEQLAAYRRDPLAPPGTPATPGSLDGYFLNTRGFDPKDFRLAPLREGARVMGDTILGRVGAEGDADPHLSFQIRPAGEGAPPIDPKPLLDGWKLLEATAIYRASGKNVLKGGTSVGQILLMPKNLLQKRVLGDDRVEIYPCGRKDIARGQVSRQVLASLAYLAEVGLEPSVSSIRCGHSYYTTSGSVSAHSSGNAVDISRWNGQPVLGHQQKGGPTYQAIKRMMLLQGTMKPAQLISLFDIGGPTIKMGDHADHLHIGFPRAGGERGKDGVGSPVLKRDDWHKLIKRLGDIDNPAVPRRASKSSLPARRGGGRSHGE